MSDKPETAQTFTTLTGDARFIDPFGDEIPDEYSRHPRSFDSLILQRACEHIIALEKQLAELKARLDAMEGGK